MAYKGKYRVLNIEKYKGNPTSVIYRSLWERKFMVYCDTQDSILKWSSEEIIIPYRSPIDRKMHRYFPDFWVKTENGCTLVEVKPKAQTKPPEKKKKTTNRYLKEVYTYGINEAKWNSAKEYCIDRGWKFKIITEDDLL